MKKKLYPVFLLLLFCVILSFYDYANPFGQKFWGNPNEMARFYSAVAFFETGEPWFDRLQDPKGPWKWPDAMDHSTTAAGHTASDKAPLTVILAYPLYLPVKAVTAVFRLKPDFYFTTLWYRFWLGLLPFLGLLWVVWKLVRPMVNEQTAWLTLFFFSLGTMNATFSWLSIGHVLSALLLAASFLFIRRAADGREGFSRNALWAGVFAGLAPVNEYTVAPVSILLFAYLVFRTKSWKQALAFAAGLVPPALVLLGYDWLVFGTPFTLSYHWVPKMGAVDIPLWTFSFKKLFTILFSDSRGLFFYSPILLFCGYGAWREIKRKNPEVWFCLAVFAFYIAFFMGYRETSDWTPGVRHFIPMLPFLAMLLAPALEDVSKKPWYVRGLFAAAGFLSVFWNILPKMGHTYYPDTIPCPHFFAGIYDIIDKSVIPLRYGDFIGLVRHIIFLLLFGTFLFLFFRVFLRRQSEGAIGQKKAVWPIAPGVLLAAAIICADLIVPHNLETIGIYNIRALGYDMYLPYRYMDMVCKGRMARIRAEFPENQAIAETGFYKGLRWSNLHFSRLYAVRRFDSLMYNQSITNIAVMTNSVWFHSYRNIINDICGYVSAHSNELAIPEAQKRAIISNAIALEKTVYLCRNMEKSRKIFEALYYSYCCDVNFNAKVSPSYKSYWMQLREW